MIQLPERDRWLFSGVFRVLAREAATNDPRHKYVYRTESLEATQDLEGRRVIDDFPGYTKVLLSWRTLVDVVKQNVTSWRAALSSLEGVYLVTDTRSGHLYVGSATGEGGFWQRWSEYASDGHGGNKDLIGLLRQHGSEYAAGFYYSILEVAGSHPLQSDVVAREQHWKSVLCSQEHGLNAN
jgi:hypothetical protein